MNNKFKVGDKVRYTIIVDEEKREINHVGIITSIYKTCYWIDDTGESLVLAFEDELELDEE